MGTRAKTLPIRGAGRSSDPDGAVGRRWSPPSDGVVRAEAEVAPVVPGYLRAAGFEVIVVPDGESAVASVRSARPDLMVLDLGLPGRDGLDVAREVRRWSSTPIFVLTAGGEETDRMVGLELGPDDYVVKP